MAPNTEAPEKGPRVHDIDRQWFKVWNVMLTDLRYATLPLETLAIWLKLLVLSNTRDSVGRIAATRRDIATVLGLSEKKLNAALDELERRGIVHISGQTILIPDERHFMGPGLRVSDTHEAVARRVADTRARTREAEADRVTKEAAACSSYMSQPRRDEKGWEDEEQENQNLEGPAYRKEDDYYEEEYEPLTPVDPEIELL